MTFFIISDNYRNILNELSEAWVMIEINHRVSKEASNSFWSIANQMFHNLYLAKGEGGRKVPQFQHIRNNLYLNKGVKVKMEIGFKAKEDGEITVVKDVHTIPVKRYPRSSYTRLYEIASVDVSFHDK